jgi:acetyl esterase/lipase
VARTSDSTNDADGVLVPEHFVPTPQTISPQAQTTLRRKPPVGGGHAVPKLDDDPLVWKAYKDAANNGMALMLKRYVTEYPADVLTHQLTGAPLYEITPNNLAAENQRRAFLYVHGGGYVVGGGDAAIYAAMQFAGLAKCKVYSTDYRMVPEFPFPTPLDDTLEAYRFMLNRHAPKNIAVFGPSAGATLAPAMIMKARDQGLPMPAACAMHSCPSDMSTWGDSGYTNIAIDVILQKPDVQIALNYANGHDLKDPYLSPVHGDYTKGFCPSIFSTGTRDLLLSNTVRLHRAMIRAGVQAELHVWEAMTHAPFFDSPEESELYLQHINFMLKHTAGD